MFELKPLLLFLAANIHIIIFWMKKKIFFVCIGGGATVYRFPYPLLPGGLSCGPGGLPCGPGGQATSYLPFLPVVTQPLSLPFPTLPHQTSK